MMDSSLTDRIPHRFYHHSPKGTIMLQWAIVFFVIAIVAAIFGFSGIAQDMAYIGKILAVIGIILAVLSYILHRRSSRD